MYQSSRVSPHLSQSRSLFYAGGSGRVLPGAIPLPDEKPWLQLCTDLASAQDPEAGRGLATPTTELETDK